MTKKIMLAVLLVALFAMPAFASVQNVKVSGFINSMFLYRDRFNLMDTGTGANIPQYEQHVFITWTGLRVDADLTDKVKATIQLLNERPWGTDELSVEDDNGDISTVGNNEIAVHLANVQMSDILDSNVSATIGRQQFNYGNAFVVGAFGQNNETSNGNALAGVANDLTMRTAYDGVKFVVDYNPLVVDLFAAKVHSNNNAGGLGAKDDDIDLFGANFNYQLGDEWNSVLEAYFFSKIDESVKTKTVAGAEGAEADTVYTPGLRASTNPLKGMNLQAEVALQRGNKVLSSALDDQNLKREAWGAQVIANYQIPLEETAKWNPMVTGVYTYVSGDSNPGVLNSTTGTMPERWTAWDPMFEDQAGGKIYNSIFDLTNAHIIEISTQFNPMEDVTTKFSWTNIRLDKEIDTTNGSGSDLGNTTLSSGIFFQPDGTSFTPRVTSNKHVGNEFDADLTYDYTEDVQFGLNFGWFFPGDMFDSSFNANAKQAMATVDVAF